MTKVVADFKALKLSEQHEAFHQIPAAYNAAKEARRQELEAEIRRLGFKNYGDSALNPRVSGGRTAMVR